MKKHGLFKILGIIMFIMIILSYFLKGRGGEFNYIGLGDVFLNGLQSMYYFFDTVLFIFVIGGFYGVLNKSSSYKKLLDKIVTSVKPLNKKFIYAVIIIFAIVASLTGNVLPLLIFIPFVISIILLLGYDKLVAISATVGSTLIGYIGGIFVTFRDPADYYGVSTTTFEEFVGLENKFANIFPKLLLLFAAIAILIFYISKHIKAVEEKKVKYEINDNTDLLVTEVKGNYKDIKTWPIIVILSLIFILMVLGMMPWNSLFGIDCFDKFHTWLTGLSIKEFAIFPNIISKYFKGFGAWIELGNYMMLMIVLLVFIFIIKLVSKMKFDDIIEGFLEGAKKMLPSVALVLTAYTILVCVYNNGFIENMITSYGKFNFGLSSLIAILGCITHVDIYYIASSVFSPMLALITDETILSSVAILFQGIYGIISIVGPTSIILIVCLTYLDVPYTTWLKYIWRFILYLVVLLALVVLLTIFL